MKNKNNPLMIAISGVAGSGKDSVMEKIWEHQERYEISISYTDRPTRPGDIPGKTYNFISKEEFDEAITKDEFIEWEQTRGQYRYGRKKADFEKAFKSGKPVVFHIDVLGAQKFKKMFKAVTVFIVPPSAEEGIRRLKARGNDNPEDLQVRIDRYSLEMSYKDKYDYILINEDLAKAQEELLQIIEKEKNKRLGHQFFLKASLIFAFLLTFASSIGFLATELYFSGQKNLPKFAIETGNIQADPSGFLNSVKDNENAQALTTDTPPKEEVKSEIVKAPPKHEAATAAKISSENVSSDGSKTVVVNTAGGSTSSQTLATYADINVSIPNDIAFSDETGAHSDLGSIIKTHLNSTLRWKGEISSMKKIILKDAGAVSWCGLYSSSYSISPSGQVTNVIGTITLNANSNCFYSNGNLFNDYMKLYFSHEYGHHYTLYHKWVDLKIPVNQRFPDEYYNIRPLNKSKTAVDYSFGWENCEAEVIAEDYSYFYSGYSLHAMHDRYGLPLPSDATRNWINKLGDSASSPEVNVTNKPPTVSIILPVLNSELSNNFNFQVDATDDSRVNSVSFYIDDKLVTTLYNSPFQISIDPSASAPGAHTLKAVASDGTLESSRDIFVIFSDSEKPEVSIISPTSNPYEWLSGDLEITLLVKDNYSVDKVEVYRRNNLMGNWLNDKKEIIKAMNLTFTLKTLPKGENTLLIKTYDTSGNTQEATLVVNNK